MAIVFHDKVFTPKTETVIEDNADPVESVLAFELIAKLTEQVTKLSETVEKLASIKPEIQKPPIKNDIKAVIQRDESGKITGFILDNKTLLN